VPIIPGLIVRIVDTHLHLIYLDKFSYPWLDNVPPLKRQWDAPSYFAEADQMRETGFVTALGGSVVAAISSCRPENGNFSARLEQLAQNPKVHGLRRILHTSPDELSQAPIFTENLKRLAAHRLSFDICVLARQLPLALRIARACPDVQFVLDHCGNPPISSGDISAWRRDITALAQLPNVAGKISGILVHSPPDWTPETLRPAVEHMIDSFGWDRVVFGSDRPVLTLNGTLTRWVEALRVLLAGASGDEQARLYHRNAERIYRI
jgi:predicted TIM-barrel fold metal-dependent hydrolase